DVCSSDLGARSSTRPTGSCPDVFSYARRISSILRSFAEACPAGYSRISSYDRSLSSLPLTPRHCPRPDRTGHGDGGPDAAPRPPPFGPSLVQVRKVVRGRADAFSVLVE